MNTTLINDLGNRLNTNDPYISSYYFWWTNITYLCSASWLFFVLLSLSLVTRAIEIRQVFILIFSIFLFIEINDFSILNQGWAQSNYIWNSLNKLLVNSLNCYHPLILYVSFFIVTFSLLISRRGSHQQLHYYHALNVFIIQNLIQFGNRMH